ncbi:hypothetical protein ZWY2020_049536 [Hordeum vulgare]|nr:hypothetical protein ZWY2020_049536 [Hordeum vulgare]
MRWQWLSRVDVSRAWSGLDLHFAPEERALFFASTTMAIGSGQRALFWEDQWINGLAIREIAPLLFDLIPKQRRKSRTVADGLHENQWAADIHGIIGIPEIGEYLRLWHAIAKTVLTDAPDNIRWKWTANGEYSAKSTYLATFHGSARCHAWKLTWKCLASVALLVPWMISKHRNGCVFEGATPSATSLAATIKEEAGLWARAGALGLQAILPQTWDVH